MNALVYTLLALGALAAVPLAEALFVRALPETGLQTNGRLVASYLARWGAVLLAANFSWGVIIGPGPLLLLPSAVVLVFAARGTLALDLARLYVVVRGARKGHLEPSVRAMSRLARACAQRRAFASANLVQCGAMTLRGVFGHVPVVRALAPVDRTGCTGRVRWRIELELASALIRHGRLNEAREALACCLGEPPTKDEAEDHLLYTARIDAALGEPDRALRVAGDRRDADWLCVRAHAHAAKGETHEATTLLDELVGANGRQWLVNVAEAGGPAASIAARLLGNEQPYR